MYKHVCCATALAFFSISLLVRLLMDSNDEQEMLGLGEINRAHSSGWLLLVGSVSLVRKQEVWGCISKHRNITQFYVPSAPVSLNHSVCLHRCMNQININRSSFPCCAASFPTYWSKSSSVCLCCYLPLTRCPCELCINRLSYMTHLLLNSTSCSCPANNVFPCWSIFPVLLVDSTLSRNHKSICISCSSIKGEISCICFYNGICICTNWQNTIQN